MFFFSYLLSYIHHYTVHTTATIWFKNVLRYLSVDKNVYIPRGEILCKSLSLEKLFRHGFNLKCN